MKQTHKQKVRIARKMRTRAEETAGVPLFQSKAWEARKSARRERVELERHDAEIRRRVKSKQALSVMPHSKTIAR